MVSRLYSVLLRPVRKSILLWWSRSLKVADTDAAALITPTVECLHSLVHESCALAPPWAATASSSFPGVSAVSGPSSAKLSIWLRCRPSVDFPSWSTIHLRV